MFEKADCNFYILYNCFVLRIKCGVYNNQKMVYPTHIVNDTLDMRYLNIYMCDMLRHLVGRAVNYWQTVSVQEVEVFLVFR